MLMSRSARLLEGRALAPTPTQSLVALAELLSPHPWPRAHAEGRSSSSEKQALGMAPGAQATLGARLSCSATRPQPEGIAAGPRFHSGQCRQE